MSTFLWGEQGAVVWGTGPGGTSRAPGRVGLPLKDSSPQRRFLMRCYSASAVRGASCPRCAGQRRVLAYLIQGAVIRRILRHLQLPEQPPRLAPALGPPQLALWA